MACSPEASVEMTVAKNSKFTKTRDDFSAIGALAAKKKNRSVSILLVFLLFLSVAAAVVIILEQISAGQQ
jgi:hypothetical protein